MSVKYIVVSSVSGKTLGFINFNILPRVGETFVYLKTGIDRKHYIKGNVISIDHVYSSDENEPDSLVVILVSFDNVNDNEINNGIKEAYGRFFGFE